MYEAKIHYEVFGTMLIKRDGKYRVRCPDCGWSGELKRLRKTCPECKNKKSSSP